MAMRRRALVMAGLSLTTAVAALMSGAPTDAASVTLASTPIDNTNCFYSNTWMAPRSSGRRHEGVDIIAKAGTKLYAANRGRIVRSQGSLAGNQAKLVMADGTYFIYAHLSAYADDTAPHGATVEAGTVIGYVGKTGATTVNHLHFEVHPSGGRAVDPTPVVAAVNTCGSKVASKAGATPSPWANVTTTTAAPRTTVAKPPTTTAAVATTVATTIATTTTAVPATPPVSAVPEPTAPSVDTTAAPTTAAPTTAAPTTAAPTTAAPTTAPPGAPGATTFSKPVLVQKISTGVAADKVSGVKVVGFPGIPKSAKSVTLVISMTGTAEGRAAIWSCGQKAGLDSGIPLAAVVAGTAVTSTVTLAPGDGGRVCMVSSAKTTFSVSVSAYA